MRIACTLILLLVLVSCSSRDHVPADCITPDQFIELYARLVYARELEHAGKLRPGVMPSEAEIARLEDFTARADLSPATWERLLAAAQDRVRAMQAGQESGNSSPGGNGGSGARSG